MSTHILGFKAPDEKWKAMKAVWDSCTAANVEPPEEVSDFFDGKAPDARGVEMEIEKAEWSDDYRSGFEIDVRSLPHDLTHIRFYNSW